MSGPDDTRELEEAWQRGQVPAKRPPAIEDDDLGYLAPRRRRFVVRPHYWFLLAAVGAFFLWDGWADLVYWAQPPRATELRGAAAAKDGLYATLGGTVGPRRALYGDREVLVLLHTPFLVDRPAARESASAPLLPAYRGSGRLLAIASAGAQLREAREQLVATGDVAAAGEVWVLLDDQAPRAGWGEPLRFVLLVLMVVGGLALGLRGLVRPPARPAVSVRFGGPAPFVIAVAAVALLTACPRRGGEGDAGPGDGGAAGDGGAGDTGASDAGGSDSGGGLPDPGGPALTRVNARAGWKSRVAVSGPRVLYRLEVTPTSHQLFLVDTADGSEQAPFPGEGTDAAIALDGRVAYAAVATTFTSREIARWDAAAPSRATVQPATSELVYELRARKGACAWRQGPLSGSQSLRLWTEAAGVKTVAEGVLAIDGVWLTDAHLVWAFKKDGKEWVGAVEYSAAGPGTRLADIAQSAHYMRGVAPQGVDLVFYMWTGCPTAPDCPLDLARIPLGGGERTPLNAGLPDVERGSFAVAAGKLVFIDHKPLSETAPYAVRWVALGAGAAAPTTLVASAPRKVEQMATDGRRVAFLDWANDPDGKWIYNDEENDPALYLSDAEALK